MTRLVRVAIGVAVLAVVVIGVRVLGADGDTSTPEPGTASGPRAVPAAPAGTPEVGMYVVSTVTDEGQVEVATWVRSAAPVSELDLLSADPDLLPGSVEALHVVVSSLDGKVLARRDSVGTNAQHVSLRTPATELYLSYTLDGAMAESTSSVAGRTLARVLAMDVDYDGQSGPVRRLVQGPGTVLNVACLRREADFDQAPAPCGHPVGDGDWEVELRGPDRGDRLLAQIEEGGSS